ncbi:hypothetical protein OB03_11740 [Brevundimonas sp. GN22]
MSDKDTPAPQSATETPAASENAEKRQALLDAAKKSMSENDTLFRRLAELEANMASDQSV